MFEQVFLGFLLGLSIYLLFQVRKIFFQVQEGSIAVVSCFGKAKTIDKNEKNLKIYASGLHFKFPWQKVRKISIKEQILDLASSEKGTMLMTSDGTLLRVDSKLRFVPLINNIYSFLYAMEKPVEHIKSFFNGLLHQEIAKLSSNKIVSDKYMQKYVGSYAILRTERNNLNVQIKNYCFDRMPSTYGFQFEGLDIIDILPPEELAQALNAVIHAQSEAEKNFAIKEAECEQKLLAAKKGIEIAKAKAKSVQAEILTHAKIIEKLEMNGTLKDYLERREVEVYSDSRISYIKG